VSTSVLFFLRLLEAAAMGGVIGWERELTGKAAGLRTNLLICVGAALLTQVSMIVAAMAGVAPPGRIAAQIVSGIGFLGAGTIIQSRLAVQGLTTAAGIWVVAAVGMTVGAGLDLQALVATAVVLATLIVLGKLEHRVFGEQLVTVVADVTRPPLDPARLLAAAGLNRRVVRTSRRQRTGGSVRLTVVWRGHRGDGPAVEQAAETLPGVDIVAWHAEG
jgi:uncharacterized membrane protein YhiD involved in acid resistance